MVSVEDAFDSNDAAAVRHLDRVAKAMDSPRRDQSGPRSGC